MASMQPWIDPDMASNSEDNGVSFLGTGSINNRNVANNGASTVTFNPGNIGYNAGNQNISAATNANQSNKVLGFTKPDADGKATAMFRGQDNDPEAFFAKAVTAKLYGTVPENLGARAYAMDGRIKDGNFIYKNKDGKEISVAMAAMKDSQGKALDALIGQRVESLQNFTDWNTKNKKSGNEAASQNIISTEAPAVVKNPSGFAPVAAPPAMPAINPALMFNPLISAQMQQQAGIAQLPVPQLTQMPQMAPDHMGKAKEPADMFKAMIANMMVNLQQQMDGLQNPEARGKMSEPKRKM